MRAWVALSNLFLDTDIRSLYPFVARELAASPYDEQALRRMHSDEIAPVLWPNLLAGAGAWIGFDEAWLTKTIACRKPGLLWRFAPTRAVVRALVTLGTRAHCSRVLEQVRALRAAAVPAATPQL